MANKISINAVGNAKEKGLESWTTAAPASQDKPQWGAARLEAEILQARELEQACGEEERHADRPAVEAQPERMLHERDEDNSD
jgi:hypothetical protein